MYPIRCFLAIKIEPIQQYFEYLHAIRKNFDVKIGIVRPELYHFTLHFFGDLHREEIETAHEALQALTSPPIDYSLNDPGSLPDKRINKTKVLYIKPDYGKEQIVNIVKSIVEMLTPLGFEPPRRSFKPHLTTARVRSGREIGELTKTWLEKSFNPENLICDKIDFIKSDLTPTGPRYTTLYEYRLN